MTEPFDNQDALQIYQAFSTANELRYSQALKDIESIKFGKLRSSEISPARLQLAYAIEAEALFAQLEELKNTYKAIGLDPLGELNFIGMSSADVIQPKETKVIARHIYDWLTPIRIWVDNDCASQFEFADIRVGHVSAMPVAASLPCSAFGHRMFALGTIKMPDMTPGTSVAFHVRNKGTRPLKFDAVLFCQTNATARLVQEAKP